MARKRIVIGAAAGTLTLVVLTLLQDPNNPPRWLGLRHQQEPPYGDCDIFFMEFFPPPSSLESFPQPMVRGNVLTPRLVPTAKL